jgi:thiol-disulfide isomerase/thioredoxin
MGRSLALAALAIATAPALAQDLYPGAKAPALNVGEWLKGGLPNGLEPGKAYVVEFWATWCGPCRTSIPHLTRLAKKYAGRVEFVGVSVWEQGKPAAEIAKFVQTMGSEMDYHVVVDKDDWMAKNWMEAAKQNGIPASFLVSDGVIQWIGHPMSLDEPLEQWAAKRIDVEANKAAFLKQVEMDEAEAAERKKVADAIKSATVQYEGGDRMGAMAMLDQLVAEKPAVKLQVASAKLNLFVKHDPAAADAFIASLAAGKSEDWRFLSSYAVGTLRSKDEATIAIGERALAAAMAAAADNDVLVCYYASLYYKQKGDKAEAIKCIDRAIALLPKSEHAENKGLEAAMEKLKNELAGK